MSNNKPPQILNQKPEPEKEMQTFHKKKLLGWGGFVNIVKIHGWADNRRIDLFRRKCDEQFGRPPNDEEIYNLMLSAEEFQIKDLARSILYNGIRVPLILDTDGTLLDGNRRCVAIRHALANNPDAKDDLENVPVWVLDRDTTDEDKRKIIVECNFLSDCKIDWPNYIKAITVYEDYRENNLSHEDIAQRYGLSKAKIRTIIKVMDLIEEFLNFHNHSDDSFRVAYEHYPFFEEANNKFRAKLDSDPDFKEQFFIWMKEDKFRSLLQVRRLGEIRDNEEAWEIIRSDSKDAVDEAIHIVQGEKLPSLVDGEKRVRKIIKSLKDLKEQEIISIRPETIKELKTTLTQVITMAEAVIDSSVGAEGESEDN